MSDIVGAFERGASGWLLWQGATLWWSQVATARGAIATALFLLFAFHPGAAKIEAFFKKSRRKTATVVVALWYAACVVWAASGHIRGADLMLATAERNASVANAAVIANQQTVRDLEAKLGTANGAIDELRARPPAAVRQTPKLALPVQEMNSSPGGMQAGRDINIASQPTADELAKRTTQRVALAELLTRGQLIRARVIKARGDEASEKEALGWYTECANYLHANLGPDYAAQFRVARPSADAIDGFPMAKMGLVNGIQARLDHLSDFITRLR